MGTGDWLAGIAGVAGGALQGGIKGYQFETERRDESKRRGDDRAFQVARDQWQADTQRQRDELLAMLDEAGMLKKRKLDADDAKAKTDTAAREGQRLHDDEESKLPEHLRGAYHIGGHKGSFKPEDFIAPKTPEQLAVEETRKREVGLEDFRKRQQITTDMNVNQHDRTARIDQQYRTPVEPNKDDPALPRGVQSYLLQLRTKHPSFQAAAGELSSTLEQLQAAHPNLSPTKALEALRRSFSGARPDDDVADIADEAARQATTGQRAAPAGGPPITPAPGRPRVGGVPISPTPALPAGRDATAAGAPSGTAAPAASDAQTVTAAELQTLATARKTTVEQEARRAAAAGYTVIR